MNIVVVILGVLVAGTSILADDKIDLEDIELDNLRAESKSGKYTKGVSVGETGTYGRSGKPEKLKQKYQPPSSPQYENSDGISGNAAHQQFQDKYVVRPTDYEPDVKYLSNSVDYEKNPEPLRYVVYQQQVESPLTKSQTSSYETPGPQVFFQPEVAAHYQPGQQRTTAKNSKKESLYVNIPMAQLLAYYRNIGIDQALLSKRHPLLHSPGQLNQQITIPVYMSHLNRDAIISNSKITYRIQPQYASSDSSRYPLLTEAILPTRTPTKFIYTEGLLAHRQPQQHYLQEIVYSQEPEALTYVGSSHETPSSYDHPSSPHLDANTLGQNYASPTRQEQTYTAYDHQSAAKYAPIPDNQIYQQLNVQQDYENIAEAPGSEHDLPRLPAQNFKPPGSEGQTHKPSKSPKCLHCSQHLVVQTSEPRSLLESYIPSNILAAQNAERYRERPIRLERGFIPSKINYVRLYEKRSNE